MFMTRMYNYRDRNSKRLSSTNQTLKNSLHLQLNDNREVLIYLTSFSLRKMMQVNAFLISDHTQEQ